MGRLSMSLVLSVALSSCASAYTETQALPLTGFCGPFARAVCQQNRDCCTEALDTPRCVAQWEAYCTKRVSATQDQALAYSAEDAARCIEELETPGLCPGREDLFLPLRDPARLPSCLRVFRPDIPIGGDCTEYGTCREGHCSTRPTGEPIPVVGPRYCMPKAAEGAPCSSGCADGLYCDGVCLPRRQVGDTCVMPRYPFPVNNTPCVAGAVCEGGACQALPVKKLAGERCSSHAECRLGICAYSRCLGRNGHCEALSRYPGDLPLWH
jgi:hypothetical protein